MERTFVFWQNILSPHQSSFLRSLSDQYKVFLVVDRESSDARQKHGWHIPDFGEVSIVVNPNDKQFHKLLNIKNSIHITSGVWAFPLANRAFRYAIKRSIPVGIFSEPFNTLGKKRILRFISYTIFNLLYGKKIKLVLTTGKLGRDCFESVGFNKKIIYDWAYFTETPHFNNKFDTGPLKLLFIGSIDTRKNILSLVNTCKKLKIIDNLSIIGTGPLEAQLKIAIKGTNCNYLGKVPNLEVQQIIAGSDLLILPSVFDGWGAVVNEALMAGTPAIASDQCGSSILLRGNRGEVFSIDKNNLEEVLGDFLKKLPYNIKDKERIRYWAIQNISGEAAAKYFSEIIDYIYNNKKDRPLASWMSSKN